MTTTTMNYLSAEIPIDIARKLAELIATYEIAVDKMIIREKDMEECFQANERYVNEQLDKINVMLNDIKELMSEAGAARWRKSAEFMLRQGKEHIKHLNTTSLAIGKTLKDSVEEFDRIGGNAVKKINETVSVFHINDLKPWIDKSVTQINELSVSALNQIYSVIKWFHWKNLLLVLGLSLMIVIIMGLYINDEWPWEMHANVIKQRAAGQALMSVWPQLSGVDQDYIIAQIIKVNKGGKLN